MVNTSETGVRKYVNERDCIVSTEQLFPMLLMYIWLTVDPSNLGQGLVQL